MVKLDMQMLTGINFVLGIVITVFAMKLSNATKTCTIEKVTNSVKGLLVVGVVLVTSSATSLACGCAKTDLFSGKVGYLASALNLVLGVTIVTLASIVHGKCEATKSDTSILIALGSIMLALSVGYIGYKTFRKVPRFSMRF